MTDSNSWETSGGFSSVSGRRGGIASGSFSGGARPQTVEIIKTINERCAGTTVTLDRTKADYVILLDHEGGKGYVRKDNKIAVFSIGGDLLFSDSTRSLGNAVKDACSAIARHSSSSSEDRDSSAVKPQPVAANQDQRPVTTVGEYWHKANSNTITLRFTSNPDKAEVDVDGVYWGSTPTQDLTRIPAGTHTILVKKSGYVSWERKIDVALGDDRTVAAELEVDRTKAQIKGLD